MRHRVIASVSALVAVAVGVVVMSPPAGAAAPAAATEPEIVDSGTHLLAPRVVDGRLEIGFWQLQPGDSVFQPPLEGRDWAALEDVVLHLPPESGSTVQPGSAIAAELPAWLPTWTTSNLDTYAPMLPLSAALVSEELTTGGGTLGLSLTAATGPGHVRITPMHATGPISTLDGLPDRIDLPAAGGPGTQQRWSFTAEGYYCLDLSADLSESPERGIARGQVAVAVGDVDPAAAPACAALEDGTAPTPAPAVAPDRKVVNDAYHNLRPRLDAGGAPRLGTFHTLTSRNVNDGGPWSRLDDTVLHLRDNHRLEWQDEFGWAGLGEPGASVWQTITAAGGGAYLFGNYGSPGAIWQSGTPVELAMKAASGPGHVLIGSNNVDARQINSSLGLPATISRSAGRADFVLTFSRPGYYCLDLELSLTRPNGEPATDRQQWPVAVGSEVDPYAAPACTQLPDGTAPDGEPNPAEEPPRTPDVLVFDEGHADLGARLDAQERLRLLFRLDATTHHELDDVVLHLKDTALATIPEPDDFQDLTHIAPPGSSVWQVPLSSAPGVPWLGFNTQSIIDRDFLNYLTWRMHGVTAADGGTAPGHVVFRFGTEPGSDPTFSTRTGFADGRLLPSRSYGHGHGEINFTDPGVYCLDMSFSSRLASTGQPTADRQFLTVLVGEDRDPASVTPCGRLGVDRAPSHPRETTPAPPGEVVVLGDRPGLGYGAATYAWLQPEIADEGLSVSVVDGTSVDGGRRYDPADVVVRAATQRRGSDDAALPAGTGDMYWTANSSANAFEHETFGIDADQVDGDISWSLTGVDGPGAFSVWDTWSSRELGRALLSTRPGHEQQSARLWPTTTTPTQWGFSEPGVYCVGLRWEATLRDGTTLSERATLTFVADTEDQGVDLDSIDPADCQPTPAASSVTIEPSAPAYAYGHSASVEVTVSAEGEPVTGAVQVDLDGRDSEVALGADGTATVALPRRWKPGRHQLTVAYQGDEDVAASSATAAVRVRKAAPQVTASLVRKKVERPRRARVRVHAVLPGDLRLPVTGKVMVRKKKVLATARLTKSSNGRTTIRLPRLRPGRHVLRVVVPATSTSTRATSKRIVLRVKH